MKRLLQHRHRATLFEQEELRLANGNYVPDAPQRLHEFWLSLGLYIEFVHTQLGDMLLARNMLCVEDIS